jgi:hypothetical protein
MYEMTLAILCLCTLTCAPVYSQADKPSGQAPRESSTHVITAAPATINLALDDQTREGLQRHLADGSLVIARLNIHDVRPRAAQTLKGVRIFIEKPDADLRTPVDDPHYAGNFVLGFSTSDSILLNIAPTLSRLWQSSDLSKATLDQRKAIRITLVPEPWDYAPNLPPDFALTIQSMALEIPSQP